MIIERKFRYCVIDLPKDDLSRNWVYLTAWIDALANASNRLVVGLNTSSFRLLFLYRRDPLEIFFSPSY